MEIKDHAAHQVQIICPRLALEAIHKVWEYGTWASKDHFSYGEVHEHGFRDIDDLIDEISTVDFLPPALQPIKLAGRHRSEWDIARSRTLPKESDPGGSHRPLCNRENYPTARLDGILCRAGITCLRALDVSEHLDVDRPVEVVKSFECLQKAMSAGSGLRIVDEDHDMKGCFTHVPQKETVRAVIYVTAVVVEMGVQLVQVPSAKRSTLPCIVSARARDGYIGVPVDKLAQYAQHHCKFCFSRLGGVVQRQVEGHPMGSAYSVFLQRCWCVFRELYFSRTLDVYTIRRAHHRVVHILFCGSWVALLEVRYADDVSQTAVVDASSDVSEALLKDLLRQRREARYYQLNGRGVTLAPGDCGHFIGLTKTIDSQIGLLLQPSCRVMSDDANDFTFQATSALPHHLGWHPPSLSFATLSGLASRAISLSSNVDLALVSLVEYLETYVASSEIPPSVLLALARKWDRLHPCAATSCVAASALAIENHMIRKSQ